MSTKPIFLSTLEADHVLPQEEAQIIVVSAASANASRTSNRASFAYSEISSPTFNPAIDYQVGAPVVEPALAAEQRLVSLHEGEQPFGCLRGLAWIAGFYAAVVLVAISGWQLFLHL